MPEKAPVYQERLSNLRKEISAAGVSGYILPRTDEFQGEFLAPYAERLAWISGFTGSAGVSVILDDKAVVMSDGRYTLQLREQVDQELFELDDVINLGAGKWILNNARQGAVIGYDPMLFTPKQIDKIAEECKEKEIALKGISGNLVDRIWFDQPSRPANRVSLFPDDIAGKRSADKRQEISGFISGKGASACLITAGDSICWLLNIRGRDIDYSPMCLSYALLYEDASLDWFINPAQVTNEVSEHLGEGVRVYPVEALSETLRQLSREKPVLLDYSKTPVGFVEIIKKSNSEVLDFPDPCAFPKSIKPKNEQEAMRKAHIEDGVALVKFLKWIDDNQNLIDMDELLVEEVLEGFRKENPSYIGPSFPTIAGFGSNGAIVHYRANAQTSAAVSGDGLLLVDSGGQYRWGTTDITRTIAIGAPTQEMKENYTRVLKGHIAVASAVFGYDCAGKEIDALARGPLLDAGLNYAHGTGHGVGCYLCVHEASTHISPLEEKVFKTGMIVSNEPGYYKEGEYGIRIENLVLVKEKGEDLEFETLSFAPFDSRLIMFDMLDKDEIIWLKSYYNDILRNISHLLPEECKVWLDKELQVINVI